LQLVVPRPSEKVPTSHFLPCTSPSLPHSKPEGQSRQRSAPSKGWCSPKAHGEQDGCPLKGWLVPGSHEEHSVACEDAEKVPGSQGRQPPAFNTDPSEQLARG